MIFQGEEAEYALSQMIPEIEAKLDELNLLEQDDYVLGLKTAYAETLELIQLWEKHALYGLDYNIEAKYPLIRNKDLAYERTTDRGNKSWDLIW